MKILVISSAHDVVTAVRRSLAGRKKLSVVAARDTADAERELRTEHPPVIMLDADMLAACSAFVFSRRGGRSFVIGIIHASAQYEKKVSAFLAAGATDVIGYPFHPAECRLRVQAAQRAYLLFMRAKRLAKRCTITRAHLDECAARLSTISNSIPAGIVIIDPETHVIVDANAAALKMFGADGEQVIGKICHQYICPAERGACPITDQGQHIDHRERILVNANGEHVPILKSVVRTNLGGREYLFEMFIDISEQKKAEAECIGLIERLQKALAEIKTLSGLLPICAACKKIRDDQGYWNEIELYIQDHSDAQFTHGICPECMKKLYP